MQVQAKSIAGRFTFKPQAKSNAKRFLVKTNKVAESDVTLYITEFNGQWGTYIDAEGKPVQLAQVEAEVRVNAPALTTDDAPVEDDETPTSPAGFSVFAAMVAPVAPPAGQASVVVRDGKVIDPNAPSSERADIAYTKGDACPLCDGDHSKVTEANPGVSMLCGACNKTFSIATGREVRAGYKREDVNRGYKIEKVRVEQNGVKRPSVGTLCGQVWAALDEIYASNMPVAADLDKIATDNGWNRNNVSCEFYQWRKFQGIKGRQVRAK